jgi:hypothetical protein
LRKAKEILASTPDGSKFELEQTLEEFESNPNGQDITLSSCKDQSKDQEGNLSRSVKSSIVQTKLTVGEESVLPVAKPDGNGHIEGMVLVKGQHPSSVDLLLSKAVTKSKLQAVLKVLQLPQIGPTSLSLACLTHSNLFSQESDLFL